MMAQPVRGRRVDAAPHILPQLAQGAWTVDTVAPRDACVDVYHRQAMLPTPVLAEDWAVKLHEGEHVYRSSLPGCHATEWLKRGQWFKEFRAMLEEVAVECSVAAKGRPITRARDHLAWNVASVPTDRVQRALWYLQLGNSVGDSQSSTLRAFWDKILSGIDRQDAAVLFDAVQAIQADQTPSNCDAWTDKLLAHFLPPPPPPPQAPPETPQAQAARAQAAQQAAQAAAQAAQASAPSSPNGQASGPTGAPVPDSASRNDSVDVTDALADLADVQAKLGRSRSRKVDVHRHLGGKLPTKYVGRTWRATDYGAVVRYPQNYHNGRVFARRSTGGSLLLDLSGSMRWDWALLESAIKKIPALWCAGYCTYLDDNGAERADLYGARVCLFAEGGRLGPLGGPEAHRGGANLDTGCDIPALAYMVRTLAAKRPYIWVSDGKTGIDWGMATTSVLRKHGIVRVATLEDAVALLRGKRVKTYDAASWY